MGRYASLWQNILRDSKSLQTPVTGRKWSSVQLCTSIFQCIQKSQSTPQYIFRTLGNHALNIIMAACWLFVPILRGGRLWSGIFHLLKFVDFLSCRRTHYKVCRGESQQTVPSSWNPEQRSQFLMGWVSSSRWVSRKAEPSDRGTLFSPQKIPAPPGKLTLAGAS